MKTHLRSSMKVRFIGQTLRSPQTLGRCRILSESAERAMREKEFCSQSVSRSVGAGAIEASETPSSSAPEE